MIRTRTNLSNKICLKSLLHIHHAYQQLIIEGGTDQNPESFTKWSDFCIVTTFTNKQIKIAIPSRSKSKGLPVAHYADHAIFTGLWLCVSDFGSDVDHYYWCRNRVTARLREMLFMLTAEGPYLTHTIKLGGDFL